MIDLQYHAALFTTTTTTTIYYVNIISLLAH